MFACRVSVYTPYKACRWGVENTQKACSWAQETHKKLAYKHKIHSQSLHTGTKLAYKLKKHTNSLHTGSRSHTVYHILLTLTLSVHPILSSPGQKELNPLEMESQMLSTNHEFSIQRLNPT